MLSMLTRLCMLSMVFISGAYANEVPVYVLYYHSSATDTPSHRVWYDFSGSTSDYLCASSLDGTFQPISQASSCLDYNPVFIQARYPRSAGGLGIHARAPSGSEAQLTTVIIRPQGSWQRDACFSQCNPSTACHMDCHQMPIRIDVFG